MLIRLFASIFSKLFIGIIRINNYSMAPNLSSGEYFLYEKQSVFLSNYRPGDVVVIQTSHSDKRTIKRVIAVETDLVEVIGSSIVVNGKHILKQEGNLESSNQTIQQWNVDSGELFVLGDNSEFSVDSRIYGSINVNLVKGRAWFRLWPFNRFGQRF